jgi:hypothetical protein
MRTRTLVVVAAVACAALPTSAHAASPYTARFAATTIGTPVVTNADTVSANGDGLAVADFNGDGSAEAVVSNAAGSSVVRVSPNAQTSPPFTQSSTAIGCAPAGLAAGDVDLDGDLDVVAACPATGQIAVLKWNGTTFVPTLVNSIIGANEVALGDVDGEGSPDAVVASPGGGQVATHVQVGSFTGAPVTNSTANPVDIALTEVNGDSKADLAVATGTDNHVRVLAGAGNGSFAASTSFNVTNPQAVAVLDANDDGNRDLLVGTNGGVILRSLGQGFGSFTAMTVVQSLVGPIRDADVGDLDGDHLRDAAFTISGSLPAVALLSKGDGTFRVSLAQAVTSLGPPDRVAIGDVNGDDANDLVTFATSGSPNLAFELSRPVLRPASSPTLDVNFGAQTVGTRSADEIVDYTNVGAAPLQMAEATLPVTGDGGDFLVDTNANPCAFVPPGASCAHRVYFQPTTTGNRSATMDFFSNSSPQISNTAVNLHGIGVAPNSGPQGLRGPTGPRGPSGSPGARGPRGRAGRDAVVTCKVRKAKKNRTKVKCTVKLVKAHGKAALRLSRHGRTYARGVGRVSHGRVDLTLHSRRPLRRGRYMLTVRISNRSGARTVIRRKVRIR